MSLIPIPPKPASGSSPKHAVTVVADPVFAPTSAMSVANGSSTDLLPDGLAASITNPSAEHSMIVVATAQLPNLNLSTRDTADLPTNRSLGVTRIARLKHTGGSDSLLADATEAFSGQHDEGALFVPFIIPPLHITLTRTIAAGTTANFTVTDSLTTVLFDTALSDHVRVGTQAQGFPNRARLVLRGTVLIP